MTGLGRKRAAAVTAGLALLVGLLGNPGMPTESRAAPIEGEASAGTATPGSEAPGGTNDPIGCGTDPAIGGAYWIAFLCDGSIWIYDRGTARKIECAPDGFEFVEATSEPDVSDNGRLVAFAARFLVSGSTVTVVRIAIYDVRSGECTLAPPPPGPERPVVDPGRPDLDPGGRWVVWAQYCQVWAWIIGSDGPPILVSGTGGNPASGCSSEPVVGKCALVAFVSTSPDLVAADTNGYQDVFVVFGLFTPEPEDDEIRRISLDANGAQRDGPSGSPAWSPNCKIAYITFPPPPTDGDPLEPVVIVTPPPTPNPPPVIEPVVVIPDTCVAGGKLVITDDTVVCETGTPTPPGKTPTNFSVLHKDGSRWWGIRIIFWIGNRVRVAFPDDTDLDKATCGAVRQGAVIDNQVLPVDLPDGRSNTNPPACVGPSDDVTDGPDLKDATVVQDDAGTPTDPGDDRSAVRLCFDEALGTLVDPEGFGLSGYNSAVRTASVAAALDPDNPACVRAIFPDGTDVGRATLATVIDAVVFDPDGHPNPEGSRPLSGTTLDPRPGDITGPNLLSAIPDLATGTVTYTFDAIATASPDARFVFVDDQGEVHGGGQISAVDAGTGKVVVAFPDNLGTARRLVALPDAVRNAGGEPNVEQSTDFNVAGPELTAVTRVEPVAGDASGPPRFDFTFNEPVRAEDIGRLFLYTADGTRFPVTAATRPAPDVVRGTAPALVGLEPSVVLGVADTRAVFTRILAPTGTEVSGAPNPLGVQPVGKLGFSPTSPTDGPDLIGVELLPGEHAVDYLFDQPVRDPHLLPQPPDPPDGGTEPTGVVVIDQQTGERQETGGSNPATSPDGRFVAYDNGSEVFRADTLVSQVNPDRVDFGTLPLGGPEATRDVTVTNRGFSSLALSGASVAGAADYRVAADTCSGRSLAPGATCAVTVAFSPDTLGARQASLLVADNAPGSPHAVALAGAGPAPTISASPRLGPPGTPVNVRGSGFPAGATVELRWTRSPDRPRDPTPLATTKVVRADAAGNLGPVALLILRGDVLGPRLLSATVRGTPVSASAPFLVVPGTAQPSGTGSSRTFGRD